MTYHTFSRHIVSPLGFVFTAALLVIGASTTRAQTLEPEGNELRVHQETASFQVSPDVASRPDGSFVTVWQDRLDGSNTGIRARLFAADGAPLGPDFQVNTFTEGTQGSPAVAVDPDGDFVIAWRSDPSPGTDSFDTALVLRRFAADGTPLGDDFQVNTVEAGFQGEPSIAYLVDGGFVVAWRSNASATTDIEGASIQARRFDLEGEPLGAEVQVNTYTPNDQYAPSVAAAPDGGYVVAWTSDGQDGYGSGVYFRRFDDDSSPLHGDVRVATTTDGFQDEVDVAVDDNGVAVFVWASESGSMLSDIYLRRFAANGQPLGHEILVNDDTDSEQSAPRLALFEDRRPWIVWQSSSSQDHDSEAFGVRARSFTADGQPDGGERGVNLYEPRSQNRPTVAVLSVDRAVAVWESDGQDGSETGIYARLFRRGASSASAALFADGFESGTTGAWSAAAP